MEIRFSIIFFCIFMVFNTPYYVGLARGQSSMWTIVHADNRPCGQSSMRTIVHWTFIQKDICPIHNFSIGIFVFKEAYSNHRPYDAKRSHFIRPRNCQKTKEIPDFKNSRVLKYLENNYKLSSGWTNVEVINEQSMWTFVQKYIYPNHNFCIQKKRI